MPNAFLNIDDSDLAVSRPVNFKVGRDAIRGMGFPDSVYIEYAGHGEAVAVEGSVEGPAPEKNYFGSDAKAVLKTTERPVMERIYENQPIRRDHAPYFADRDLFAFLRPAFTPYEVTLNFELRFKGESDALRWFNDILARSQLARTILLHKVEYHYPIPEEGMFSLYCIHKTREEVEPTGEDFSAWFHRCKDPRVTVISNRSGEQLRFVVAETMVNVQGWYDFAAVGDAPVYDKEHTVWKVSFDYKFLYNKPIGSTITYPITVMNKMLPREVLSLCEDYNLSRENVALDTTTGAYELFANTYGPMEERLEVARIPAYDNWSAQLADPWTHNFMIVLMGVTKADPRTIMNIKTDLKPYSISADTLALIKKERNFVTKRRRSLFHISVFANDFELPDGTLTLDEDFNLVATRDLELLPVYHVRLAWITSLDVLSPVDQDRLRQEACDVYKLLAFLYPHLVANGMIPSPSFRCRWTQEEWDQIKDAVRPPGGGPGGPWQPGTDLDDYPRTPTPPTVGVFGITARRKTDAGT